MRNERQLRERLEQYEDVLQGLIELQDRSMQISDTVMVDEANNDKRHCQQTIDLLKWILEEI